MTGWCTQRKVGRLLQSCPCGKQVNKGLKDNHIYVDKEMQKPIQGYKQKQGARMTTLFQTLSRQR